MMLDNKHGILKTFYPLQQKMSFHIISVKQVPGTDFVSNWKRNPMQVVETDRGIFIDNPEGIQNGDFSRGSPGYNWEKEKGKVVDGIWVTITNDYCWLNKIS
jgi:hypothetical protein